MLAVGFVRVFLKLIEEFELVTCFFFVVCLAASS